MRINVSTVTAKVKNNTKLMAGIAAGLIIGGTTSMVALATIPDAHGKINACYSNTTGVVRIIDSPSVSCAGGETGIAWD